MRALGALFVRDLRLAVRSGGGAAISVIFFLAVVTVIPFGVGPDLNLLARIGPAVLWLGALLATLLGLDRLFQADLDDGSLDLLHLGGTPLELAVAVKAAAHWVTTGLPLVVHTRDAEDDTAIMIGKAVEEGGVTGVLHCFTGSQDLARKALDLGFYISLSGIVTFKNARELQETAKIIPDHRILVETDSPFLAPVPHRGQTCEPAFVADTARFVAELRGVPLEMLAQQTTDNFFKLFNKAVA